MLPPGDGVHQLICLIVREGHHRHQGIEQFVLNDGFLDFYRINDCRGIPAGLPVSPASKHDSVPIALRFLLTGVISPAADQPGIFRIGKGILPDLGYKSHFQFPEKVLRHLLRHRHLIDIDADLAAVLHFKEGDFSGSVL